MTGTSTPELVDTRDMVVVHTALLRELRLAPGLVERTTDRDPRVVAHLTFVLEMLTHHHAGEDRLLWPKLTVRIPEEQFGLVATMESQHVRVGECVTEVRAALDGWRGAGQDLAAALRRLHGVVAEHLRTEEEQALPLAALHLTRAEWSEIGASGAASTPTSRILLVLGMFMYEGDPEVLVSMLATAPAPVRMLVPRLAPWVYARYCRRLHGTATP